MIPVEFEQRLASNETLRDPLGPALLQIPAGDLSVQVQKRDSRIQIQQTKKVRSAASCRPSPSPHPLCRRTSLRSPFTSAIALRRSRATGWS